MKRGYSMLELIAVLVLMLVIGALALWSFGATQERAIREKTMQRLVLIDSAKSQWRIAHMRDAFPGDNASRFTAISPYLKVGLQTITTLDELNSDDVTYTIQPELTQASAVRDGKTFDRAANDWAP